MIMSCKKNSGLERMSHSIHTGGVENRYILFSTVIIIYLKIYLLIDALFT